MPKLQLSSRHIRKAVGLVLLFAITLVLASQCFAQQSDNVHYEYDRLNRVTRVTYDSSGAAIIYTYDAAGNRTATTIQGTNLAPVLTDLNPGSVPAGTHGFTLGVNGNNLINGAVVKWNGSSRTTTYFGSYVTIELMDSDLATPQTANVTVVNPAPTNSTSNTVTFVITSGSGQPPTTTTVAASSIGTVTATLNGSINANGLATNAWFEWGTDPSLVSNSATIQQSIGSATSTISVNASLTGLIANTTYFFRVVGSNSAGVIRGAILSLQTAASSATVYAEYNLRGDFDGDRKADISVWRPATGQWFIVNSSNGTTRIESWGTAGDIPVPADYDGDGKTDLAVYRPSGGLWCIVNSSNGSQRIQSWGLSDDVPLAGDYDGDGKADIVVWRPSNGLWFILNSTDGSASVQGWGTAGDVPVPGDYDGDHKSDLAVWRALSGQWFIINSSNGAQRIQTWGAAGDLPAGGDYDGDGKTDLAVFRPSTGVWYIINSLNNSQRIQSWGTNGDIPVASDFDGDAKCDIAVWRPASGTWYVVNSSNSFQRVQNWGMLGDVPVSATLIIR